VGGGKKTKNGKGGGEREINISKCCELAGRLNHARGNPVQKKRNEHGRGIKKKEKAKKPYLQKLLSSSCKVQPWTRGRFPKKNQKKSGGGFKEGRGGGEKMI